MSDLKCVRCGYSGIDIAHCAPGTNTTCNYLAIPVLPDTIQVDRAEYEALKADAERYRWLRDVDQKQFLRMSRYGWNALDAAIDAAIKQEGGE